MNDQKEVNKQAGKKDGNHVHSALTTAQYGSQNKHSLAHTHTQSVVRRKHSHNRIHDVHAHNAALDELPKIIQRNKMKK